MAKSNFDISLLTPADDIKSSSSSFEANLTPATEENTEDSASYLDNMPAPEGFFKKLPRNVLIGLAKLGHSTLNLPHDLTALAERRMRELSEPMNKKLNAPNYNHAKLSDYVPKQADYNFAEIYGQKGMPTLMDKLIQGGVEYLPEIIGGRGLLKAAAGRLTGTHHLNAVEKAAQEFGMNNFGYSPEVVAEARKYMPKTEATRQLFSNSVAGEYPASFSLRSQLGKHQRDLTKSPLASERLLAPEIGDLRQKMLAQLDQGLREQGMHVEADMLKTGMKNYSQYIRLKNAVLPILKTLGIPIGMWEGGKFLFNKGKSAFKD